jgi:GT2 family glycosyltransferase
MEPGVNIARGRTIAIERAGGDVIAVTDGGCLPERDWLAELVAPLEADPAVGAVGGSFIPVAKTRFEHYCGKLSVPDMQVEAQRGMFYGRSSAYRRSLWAEAGGYPEWLYTGEDTLFALRAGKLAGYKIVHAPASILHWRPRSTLTKLAKMFYLYGRGNGRIQHGSLAGSLYWLRYHLAFAASLLAGAWFPAAWLVTIVAGWHLYRGIVKPNLEAVQAAGDERADRLFHVPLIAITRNLATNLGFLRGWIEYKRGADFKAQLDRYLGRP